MNRHLKTAIIFSMAALTGLISLPSHADQTHLNVDHFEMVHLRWFNSDGLCSLRFRDGQFKQVRQTGKLANSEFLVPAGKELVITDVIWTAKQTTRSALWLEGKNLSATIEVITETGALSGDLARRLGIVKTATGTQTIEGTEISLKGGYRVASRRGLCANAYEFSGTSSSSAFRGTTVDSMEIFGYLINKTQ